MRIKTDRLEIRQLLMSDLNNFHLYRSNPEITKYQGFDVMSIEQAKSFIEENSGKSFGIAGEWVQFGIEKTETTQLIGDCAIKLQQHDSRIAEIGITISHLEQKKGYAKEAFSGILRFLFAKMEIHRVVILVDAENTASLNLFKSIGIREEGHFVESIFFKGKWASEIQFAVLKSEWSSINLGRHFQNH